MVGWNSEQRCRSIMTLGFGHLRGGLSGVRPHAGIALNRGIGPVPKQRLQHATMAAVRCAVQCAQSVAAAGEFPASVCNGGGSD